MTLVRRSPSATAPARRAAILVPRLARGDAVGNDTAGLAQGLRALGLIVEVFASEPEADVDARPLEDARTFLTHGPALAIYQLATQWNPGLALFRTTPAGVRRVVRDHNVTPARFLAFLGDELARVQTGAERQRRELARDRSVDLFLPASRSNAHELVALGAPSERIAVVPPFTPIEGDATATAEDGAPARAADRPGACPPTALFVGRLAPHKGHRRAMRVAAVYAELFGEPLRLRFVGSSDRLLAPWRRVLEREERRLGLSGRIEWHANVGRAALAGFYASADLFLCCSEHEGFCVPLVEATHFGLPVVATHLDALRDTLGPEALLLPASEDDDVLAAAVHDVVHDPALRRHLVTAQRTHVARHFSACVRSAALTTALAHAALGAAFAPVPPAPDLP